MSKNSKTNKKATTPNPFKRTRLISVIVIVLVFVIAGAWRFFGDKDTAAYANSTVGSAAPTEAANIDYASLPVTSETNPIATIVMENGGVIVVELYPDVAPNTVANFVTLANSGFYDGLIFHRVIPGFMIQGGDPNGNGTGGPGYSIKGEFTQNGFRNDLKHTRGVLSMARSNRPNSAGSQFFIMHADAPHLDGAYASFGMVLTGMDVVDAIATTPRNSTTNKPYTEQKIKSITVDTKGIEYQVVKIGG